MKVFLVLFLTATVFGGVLKDDALPGVDIESSRGTTRFVTQPSSNSEVPQHTTKHFSNSRGSILWADRVHLNAIAQHVAMSGDGMWIQAGWWLNAMRTSLYRTLGTNVPNWSYPMTNAEWFIPVDMAYTGMNMCAGGTGEPFMSFSASSPAPLWYYNLPDGFVINTSSQGRTVAVNDMGTIYAVLGSSTSENRLFIFDESGDTIRTITYAQGADVYGLDISGDGTIFCITTYDDIYFYNLDGSMRDVLNHYGQTVAQMSADGNYCVRGDFYGRVYLYRWNGTNYAQVWQHYVGHPWVTSVALSDDGSTIMAGTFQYTPSNSGKVLMYDSSSATPLWEYNQYGDFVACCELSADGSRGVAGSWGQYGGTFGDVATVFEKASATPLFQILDDVDEPGSIMYVDIADDGSFVTAGGKAVHAREWGYGGEVYAVQIRDALTHDVGVREISVPGSFLVTGQSITPQAVVQNYGTATESFDVVCIITDSAYSELYCDTMTVSDLASSASQAVVFSQSWSVPYYGSFFTTVYTTLVGDEFSANDSCDRVSICYHDGAVTSIDYPFAEVTLNYAQSPRVNIKNWGSYAENVPVACEIYDKVNALVYTGTGQAYLNPLQSAAITMTPAWAPADTGSFTVYVFTQLGDDYDSSNDTAVTQATSTTEILYDDGFLDVYSYVSSNYYENKFAEKMIPCLPTPYYIIRARFFVSDATPIQMSLNSDSSGLPGLGETYYIAKPETLYPAGTGWVVREFAPPIQMDKTDPFWLVVHWLPSSPSAPYIGMDDTEPLDTKSYWYWTEQSDPGWHAYPWYDFMMRVFTASEVGIDSDTHTGISHFMLHCVSPNPFTQDITLLFSVPRRNVVTAKVYDITGRLVSTLLDEPRIPGEHRITWNGRDDCGRTLSSGVYFLRVDYEQESIGKKLILIAR